MAKITDGTFRDWQDSEIINATDYKREREILKVAANDNDERISSIEESVVGFQLDNAQLQKITDNTGGVKISVTDTSKGIITEILKLGKGLHTFYAIGGSKQLPDAGISIRGTAHITGTEPNFGYFTAIDYKNNMYISYIDNNNWSGWKGLLGFSNEASEVAGPLNTMKDTGIFYVNAGTSNMPGANSGHLIVTSANPFKSFVAQMFIDSTTAVVYTRTGNVGVWTAWKRHTTDSDTQDQLWSSSEGFYMHAGQTVTPIKKLSQCRTGWILVWSDYNVGDGSNNVDISYSYIPKGSPFKSGHQHFFSVPTFQSDTAVGYTVKRLTVYDDRIVGNVNNDKAATGANDVVLRSILEW